MLKTKYRVERRSNSDSACNVFADNREVAALRGAIKLGIRHFGRRPTLAVSNAPGSSLHSIYGPTDDPRCQSNCNADVYVTDM